jgi:hypothetical protein
MISDIQINISQKSRGGFNSSVEKLKIEQQALILDLDKGINQTSSNLSFIANPNPSRNQSMNRAVSRLENRR